MKYIAIVDLPDDAPEYGEWQIDDEGSIRYLEDENCWTHYKDIDVDGIRLVPLPTKADVDNVAFKSKSNAYRQGFISGYNCCIDEISGEW